MHHFSVWAPRVQSCSVLVNGVAHPLTPSSGGCWSGNVQEARHDTDYQFLLDDDAHPYPDPRSAWQPNGVHNASRVLDHSCHDWSDDGWSPVPLSKAAIYELHVGTFTPQGTFAAAAERLSALRELGITHVELMPVNSFPGRWGWGYDGVALFAPQEQYGGPEGLKQFVDASHAVGLAVLLDVVYNHFGPDGNYSGRFAPYITEKYHTPWGGAINFDDQDCEQVRRFFCDNALMWLRDYHIDGLRLDAIHAFVDSSEKHFMKQLSEEVEALSLDLNRSLVLIAESDLNDPRVVTPQTAGGYGIDAQWSDDFHHAVLAFLTGERQSYYRDFGSLAQIAKSLQSAYVFDGEYSKYRNGPHGFPVGKLSAHRFLGYIQNHDQVGNRVFGDRIHEATGIRKARLAAALMLTSPFVPMIFQGEEFAASSPFLYFADHDDPELARAVSEGRRREHSHELEASLTPDPESPEAFERSKLHWEERDKGSHREMLDWYRALIQLRTSNDCLLDESFDNVAVRFDEDERWIIVDRGNVELAFNFGGKTHTVPVPAGSQIMLTSDANVILQGSMLALPAETFAALLVSR